MRIKLASALLVLSVVGWGIYCGGQVFNELMVVPKWSYDPPESLKAYNAIKASGGVNFFLIFVPMFTLLSLVSTIAAWSSARSARSWLGLSTLIAVCLFVALIGFLAPLVGGMFRHAAAGDMPASEIIAGVAKWRIGNQIRLAVETFGFLCAVVGLRIWSAETTATVT